MLKKISLIIVSFPCFLVSLYVWTWVLFKAQEIISEQAGMALVMQGDEWHPVSIVLLILLTTGSSILLLKLILKTMAKKGMH